MIKGLLPGGSDNVRKTQKMNGRPLVSGKAPLCVAGTIQL